MAPPNRPNRNQQLHIPILRHALRQLDRAQRLPFVGRDAERVGQGLVAGEGAQAVGRVLVGKDGARRVLRLVFPLDDVERVAEQVGDGHAERLGNGAQLLVGDALGAAFQARDMRLVEADELAQAGLSQALLLAQILQVGRQFIHMSNMWNPSYILHIIVPQSWNMN